MCASVDKYSYNFSNFVLPNSIGLQTLTLELLPRFTDLKLWNINIESSPDLDYLSSDEIDVDSDTGGIPILEELGLGKNIE